MVWHSLSSAYEWVRASERTIDYDLTMAFVKWQVTREIIEKVLNWFVSQLFHLMASSYSNNKGMFGTRDLEEEGGKEKKL